MCGIAGILTAPTAARAGSLAASATAMARRLAHRGPDGHGVWSDEAAGIALGHRRLAIVDLSEAGHQPMRSASNRFVLSFNGEIYNFRELRRELEASGHRFAGGSDTEVLLAAIEAWGLVSALRRSVGMFALAVWDREERVLHLARDRLGKKPLYVATCDGRLLFGSELKALHAFPGFRSQIDRGALSLLIRYGYVPDPHCIFAGAIKLRPATVLSIRPSDLPTAGATELLDRAVRYWDLAEVVSASRGDPLDLGESGAAEALDRLLRQAVAQRMIADVPLGVFLSGGIDSSLVAALMQAQSADPVRSFTIGFEHDALDEAKHARRVAAHLGTDHTELLVRPADAVAVIPRLAEIYDEPFADSSQIPTHLVSRMAREHVTVALSGDGGDEVFGGYDRHFQASRLQAIYRTPHAARAIAARLVLGVPASTWDRAFTLGGRAVPALASGVFSGERVHKFARIMSFEDTDAMYRLGMISLWSDPSAIVVDGREPPSAATGNGPSRIDLPDAAGRMMVLDTLGYLPGDILVKLDRASMAVGLEARCPLLDHRVVELAWRLPPDMKVRGRIGKWLLRQVLARYVPPALFERPKQGFGIPLGEWLRGPLRPWAEALLDASRLRQEGFFHAEPIRRGWQEHLDGTSDWSHRLWNVLMFQAWRERWQHTSTDGLHDAA